MHCVGGDAARLMVVVVCPCVVGLRCPGAVQSFLVLRRRARTLSPAAAFTALTALYTVSLSVYFLCCNQCVGKRTKPH